MLVTKTPLRISFFGGGSDIPEFYNQNSGMVISTSINKYIYLAMNVCESEHIRLTYSTMEYVKNVKNLKHDRAKECLEYFNIINNIEICSFSAVPTKGTGLGSSSTFTVGLLNGLYYIKNGKLLNKKDLAELACYIEIDKCKEPIGKQDQYAASFGGLNIIRFSNNGVEINKLAISCLDTLKKNLFMFNTGINRKASNILEEQVNSLKKNINIENTKKIVDMAEKSVIMLKKEKLDDFGDLLNESWQIKKKLSSNVSNDYIDDMYETAIKSGALGGKILGAGGGGYMMFYVPQSNHTRFLKSMENYKKFDFEFENSGSTLEIV